MDKKISRRGFFTLIAGAAVVAQSAKAEAFDFLGGGQNNSSSHDFGVSGDYVRQPVPQTPSYTKLPMFETDYAGNAATGSIQISIANAQLYHILGNGKAMVYPIAAGPDSHSMVGQAITINHKKEWPSWTPTENIRREQAAKGIILPRTVPGGQNNPLGQLAMYLYDAQGRDTIYRIHGTNAPWTIGDNSASSGCIRMYNDHVVTLAQYVPNGTSVTVVRGDVPGIGVRPSLQSGHLRP